MMQLMKRCNDFLHAASCKNVYLRPYDVFMLSNTASIVEHIPDTQTITKIANDYKKKGSLRGYYKLTFRDFFDEAQMMFAESLAGYSLFSYLFNLRDVKPDDIVIDSEGHLIIREFTTVL